MESSKEKNKRIAKNTLFLYFRQMIVMGVQLYTSRIVLDTLGVSDYGINNIVSGLIGYFAFLNIAMNAATRRFLAFELGKGDGEQLKRVFSMSMNIYLCIIGITFILAETVGLWFLNTQLNIPIERMVAANFIYQFSIFSTCVGLLNVPYNSTIFAHEKFSFFAYMSMLEVSLKLCIVFLLVLISYDKLILLGGLSSVVSIIIFLCYKIYCNINFTETFYKPFWNKHLFQEIISFSGWTLLGGISWILLNNGINTLLNIFYGVKINAAFGIANQVSLAIFSFFSNFSTALSPQIIKAYAENAKEHLNNLIHKGTKFSFYLIFIIAVPVILNLEFILSLWLKQVPEYTADFCRLIIISFIVPAFYNAPNELIIASGKMKTLAIAVFFESLLCFFVSYMVFKMNFSVISIGYIYIIYRIVYVLIILYLAHFMVNFSIKNYVIKSIIPCLIVIGIVIPLPIFIANNTIGWSAFFFSSGSFFLITCPTILYLGMERNERDAVFKIIRNKLNNILG